MSTEPAWPSLPLKRIRLDLCTFPCHDLDPAHVHSAEGCTLSTGPIHVERLVTGHWFIHDGRHRVLRAQNRGDAMIDARVLERNEEDCA